MTKILIMLSEYGFWGEELIGPLETFDAAGYDVVFATPNGKRPVALPPSMDANYQDPPLGRSVTSPEMAEKVQAIEKSPRLGQPPQYRLDGARAALLQLDKSSARTRIL